MNKSRVLGMIVAAQLMLSVAPALALDGDYQPSGSKWSKFWAAPKAAAGVVYGVTFGVPIRAGKYMYSESNRMTRTLQDDFGGPGFWNTVMARSAAVPYGIASGSVLGVIRGVQYGGQYGAEEPFSKKSIGLGEPCVVGQR
jgi:hypothetical protein